MLRLFASLSCAAVIGLSPALAGDTAKATSHFRQLVENCGEAGASLPSLEVARSFLARN